jgi:hypothetical protein
MAIPLASSDREALELILAETRIPKCDNPARKGRSMMLGWTLLRGGQRLSQQTLLNGNLLALANSIVAKVFPNFVWSSVQVNMITTSIVHTDKYNIGPSVAMIFGNIPEGGGGELMSDETGNVLCPMNAMAEFSGLEPHYVKDYDNERFTRFGLIFFNHRTFQRASFEHREILRSFNFRLPPLEEPPADDPAEVEEPEEGEKQEEAGEGDDVHLEGLEIYITKSGGDKKQEEEGGGEGDGEDDGESGSSTSDDETFQIFVAMHTGRTIFIDAAPSDTARRLKLRVKSFMGVRARSQRLIFRNQEMLNDHQLSIYGLKDKDTVRLVLHLVAAGKRGRDGAGRPPTSPADVSAKMLKIAAAKLEAEAHWKTEIVDNPVAMEFMEKSKNLVNTNLTAKNLCEGLTTEKIHQILALIRDDTESNGDRFHIKLLPHFIDGFQEFRKQCDQMAAARAAVERGWMYRVNALFMNAGGALTRDGIKEAVETHRDDMTKMAQDNMKQVQQQQQVEQRVRDAMQNPQVLAVLTQDPQMQQMIMNMMQQAQQANQMQQ